MKTESNKEIAERIVRRGLGFQSSEPLDNHDLALIDAIEAALDARDKATQRAERKRAVRLIDEHQALDVCLGNCWEMIRTAIRGGKD